MTSGGGVKYKGSLDCGMQILKRGLHVHDEGSRRQRAERCGRCRCARWLRQVPGHVHRLENQPVNGLFSVVLLSCTHLKTIFINVDNSFYFTPGPFLVKWR